MDQPDLFSRPAQVEDHPSTAKLLLILRTFYTTQWATRKDLTDGHAIAEREIREGRQFSKGRIIFGQSGYKLASAATLEELHACAATMISQIQAMQEEVQELNMVIHGRSPAQ